MFRDEGIEQFALEREIVVHWALRKAEAGYVPIIDDAPIPPDGHFEQQYDRCWCSPPRAGHPAC